jgi:hypothetical protein
MRNYTAEQLQANYDKFIEALKKVFTGERLEGLLHMYSESELGQELAMAPASGKEHYHSAYVGGYIDHVLRVARNCVRMKRIYTEGGLEVDFTDEEMLFAAFHHDLGKLGTTGKPHYVPEESDWHRKNQGSMFKINGENHFMDVTHRALWLLNQYGIKYTEKEMIGIMLADGLYNDATKPYFISFRPEMRLKTDLPYILHWSDHMSCRQENKEWTDLQEKSPF